MKRSETTRPGHHHGVNMSDAARNQELWETAMAAAGVVVCHVDSSGWCSFDTPTQARFGLPAEIPLHALIRHIEPSHRRDVIAMIRGVPNLEHQRSSEFAYHAPNGETFWLRIIARCLSGHCQEQCAVVTIIDMTADHQKMEALAQSEEHLRYTVEFNPQLPWVADQYGNIVDITDRWLAASGMSRDVALGEGWLTVAHPDDLMSVSAQIAHSLNSGDPFDVRVRLRVKDDYRWMRAQGFPRRDPNGNIVRWYGYTEDIHEHVLVENQIRWNAEHDPLTGLANRHLLNATMESTLYDALQNLSRVGILFIDLDHFKEINDLLGHHAGDELLQNYAQMLMEMLPDTCLVARLGGDEFAILFRHLTSREELMHWGEKISEIRCTISQLQGPSGCRASIGAAIYPEHGQNPSELMRHADIALYAAKQRGRGEVVLYEAQMQQDMREHSAMISRARTAAKSGDILAYYQPKVSMETGDLIGFEALLRWRDAKGNIHAPASINAAFEEAEVADMLGQAMLEHVVSDISRWQRQGLEFGHVAINVAPAEFRHANFAPRLLEAMHTASLPHHLIEVEITEGVFLGRGADQALKAIGLLSEQGFPIVLDDFGTGFASLSHLRALPVDTLKVDRSFVSHITEENGDAVIISAIIKLGEALGIKVVAEGIETQLQADILRGLGCRFAQGYLFGMPTPAMNVPRLIREWNSQALHRNAV